MSNYLLTEINETIKETPSIITLSQSMTLTVRKDAGTVDIAGAPQYDYRKVKFSAGNAFSITSLYAGKKDLIFVMEHVTSGNATMIVEIPLKDMLKNIPQYAPLIESLLGTHADNLIGRQWRTATRYIEEYDGAAAVKQVASLSELYPDYGTW